MANLPQIILYIKQYMGKYSMDVLKTQLLKQKVPPEMIDQAIRLAQVGPMATQAIRMPPQLRSGGVQPAQPAPGQPQRPPAPAQQPGAPQKPSGGTQPLRPAQPGAPAQRPTTQPVQPPGRPGAPGQPAVPAPRPATGIPTPAPRPAPGQPQPAQPAAAGLPPGYIPPWAPPVKPPPGLAFVLVVDDDQLIRDLLVSKLGDAGYRVTSAEDAAQTVIQAEGMRLAILISDIEMPGFGSGVDALKKLRASNFVKKNLPVIFVTGMPPAEAKRMVPLNDPYVRLLHKPVNWRLLQLYIRDLTGMDKPLS